MEHKCQKEATLAELNQLIRSIEGNEERVYQSWHDIRGLEIKQEQFSKEHQETLELIREIKDCQNQLVKEIVKINTKSTTMRYLVGIFFTVFGGIICFLVTELIKII